MRWRPVVGYEDKYEVSSCGIVRTVDGRVLKQWANDQGYCLVRVSRPRTMFRVHRLVAQAFIPNPNNLPCVNHLDCVRHNNHVANLEWCTQQQNLAHAQALGRMQRDYWKGRRSPNAKISEEQVAAIRTDHARGVLSWTQIGNKYGVSKRAVGRIVRRESYV